MTPWLLMALPEKYRKRMRSTNMQERMNPEVRHRERVIRIFPNNASAGRLTGALLMEPHETWLELRCLEWENSGSGWVVKGARERRCRAAGRRCELALTNTESS